uniref:Tyrosine-protein phosphatase domain-containing protein n=1 Tax=Rhabditophanes sp. KR3021 TaxID=114890 RepID=A0AC35U2G3_9BILA
MFTEEYAGIRPVSCAHMSKVEFDAHMPLHRYKDIICLDKTKVNLTILPGNQTYIHGSFINSPGLKLPLIAMQSPLNESIIEFWRCVIQEKVLCIVKLCQTVENGNRNAFNIGPKKKGYNLTSNPFMLRIYLHLQSNVKKYRRIQQIHRHFR